MAIFQWAEVHARYWVQTEEEYITNYGQDVVEEVYT